MSQYQQRSDKQEYHVKKFCEETDKDRTTKADQQTHLNMIHHKSNANCQFVSPPTSMNPFVQDNSHFGVDYRAFGDTSPFSSQTAMNSAMNFITASEYNSIKKENENLQSQLLNMQTTLDQFKKSASGEIDGVKKENFRLKLQIEQLQKDCYKNGTVSIPSASGVQSAENSSVGSTSEDSSIVERLVSLERELREVKSRVQNPAPYPPPAVLEYFTKLLTHYSSTSIFTQKPFMYSNSQIQSGADIIARDTSLNNSTASQGNDRKHGLAESDNSEKGSPPSKLPKMRTLSGDYIKQDLSRDSSNQDASDTDTSTKDAGMPLLPPPIVTVESHVSKTNTDVSTVQSMSEVWSESEVVTPCVPAPEDSPYTPKVQLLPKYNIWVNRTKLTSILQEAASQPTDNAPLFVLRRLIPMVFSLEEMATSRGQGITMKTKGKHDMHSSKSPLDPVKIAACKDFMKMYCSQNELTEPTSVSVNSQFTHCITYARNKLKRMSSRTPSKASKQNENKEVDSSSGKEYSSNDSAANYSTRSADNSGQLVQNDGSFENQLPDAILNDK